MAPSSARDAGIASAACTIASMHASLDLDQAKYLGGGAEWNRG